MKTKTLYTCEICHTDYNSKTAAADCEKNHASSLTIKEARYRPHIKFPTTITITDGKEVVTYKR